MRSENKDHRNSDFERTFLKLNPTLPSSARAPRRFRPAASRPRPSLRGSYVKCKNVFTPNCGTVVSLATSLTTESNKIIKITQLKKKNKDLKRRLRYSPSADGGGAAGLSHMRPNGDGGDSTERRQAFVPSVVYVRNLI